MENKTYKDKLKNIIRQLPWLYDTENSAIVSAVNTVEWFYDLIYAIMIDYLHKNV